MVMVPDAGKMPFRHSDQQNSSGGGPRPPHGLRNFGARRVGLHTTWSAPKPKILATPLKDGRTNAPTELRTESFFLVSYNTFVVTAQDYRESRGRLESVERRLEERLLLLQLLQAHDVGWRFVTFSWRCGWRSLVLTDWRRLDVERCRLLAVHRCTQRLNLYTMYRKTPLHQSCTHGATKCTLSFELRCVSDDSREWQYWREQSQLIFVLYTTVVRWLSLA